MVERGRNIFAYLKDKMRPPRELNRELCLFYDYISRTTPASQASIEAVEVFNNMCELTGLSLQEDELPDEVLTIVSFIVRTIRSEKSEVRARLGEKLPVLLSRSHLTTPAQAVAEDAFYDLYGLGIDPSAPPPVNNIFYHLLDLENSSSGGVFDRKRVKELEKGAFELYHRRTIDFIFAYTLLGAVFRDKFSRIVTIRIGDDIGTLSEKFDRITQTDEDWHRAYTKRYGQNSLSAYSQ